MCLVAWRVSCDVCDAAVVALSVSLYPLSVCKGRVYAWVYCPSAGFPSARVTVRLTTEADGDG